MLLNKKSLFIPLVLLICSCNTSYQRIQSKSIFIANDVDVRFAEINKAKHPWLKYTRARGHSGFPLGLISVSNFQNGGLNERATVCGIGRLVAAA